jgi:hypothetical protein
MSQTQAPSKLQLFLIRGLVAIAWAAAFAAVSDSLTTGVTVGAGVLLVLYPLIDMVASLLDARTQRGSARRPLLANAAVSAVAAIALGVAATGTVAPSPVQRSSSSPSGAVRNSATSGRCCSPTAYPSSAASPSSWQPSPPTTPT